MWSSLDANDDTAKDAAFAASLAAQEAADEEEQVAHASKLTATQAARLDKLARYETTNGVTAAVASQLYTLFELAQYQVSPTDPEWSLDWPNRTIHDSDGVYLPKYVHKPALNNIAIPIDSQKVKSASEWELITRNTPVNEVAFTTLPVWMFSTDSNMSCFVTAQVVGSTPTLIEQGIDPATSLPTAHLEQLAKAARTELAGLLMQVITQGSTHPRWAQVCSKLEFRSDAVANAAFDPDSKQHPRSLRSIHHRIANLELGVDDHMARLRAGLHDEYVAELHFTSMSNKSPPQSVAMHSALDRDRLGGLYIMDDSNIHRPPGTSDAELFPLCRRRADGKPIPHVLYSNYQRYERGPGMARGMGHADAILPAPAYYCSTVNHPLHATTAPTTLLPAYYHSEPKLFFAPGITSRPAAGVAAPPNRDAHIQPGTVCKLPPGSALGVEVDQLAIVMACVIRLRGDPNRQLLEGLQQAVNAGKAKGGEKVLKYVQDVRAQRQAEQGTRDLPDAPVVAAVYLKLPGLAVDSNREAIQAHLRDSIESAGVLEFGYHPSESFLDKIASDPSLPVIIHPKGATTRRQVLQTVPAGTGGYQTKLRPTNHPNPFELPEFVFQQCAAYIVSTFDLASALGSEPNPRTDFDRFLHTVAEQAVNQVPVETLNRLHLIFPPHPARAYVADIASVCFDHETTPVRGPRKSNKQEPKKNGPGESDVGGQSNQEQQQQETNTDDTASPFNTMDREVPDFEFPAGKSGGKAMLDALNAYIDEHFPAGSSNNASTSYNNIKSFITGWTKEDSIHRNIFDRVKKTPQKDSNGALVVLSPEDCIKANRNTSKGYVSWRDEVLLNDPQLYMLSFTCDSRAQYLSHLRAPGQPWRQHRPYNKLPAPRVDYFDGIDMTKVAELRDDTADRSREKRRGVRNIDTKSKEQGITHHGSNGRHRIELRHSVQSLLEHRLYLIRFDLCLSLFLLFRTEFPDLQCRCRKSRTGHAGNFRARDSRPQRRTVTDEFERTHGLTASCGVRYEVPSESDQLEASASTGFDHRAQDSDSAQAEFRCNQGSAAIEYQDSAPSDDRTGHWWHAIR